MQTSNFRNKNQNKSLLSSPTRKILLVAVSLAVLIACYVLLIASRTPRTVLTPTVTFTDKISRPTTNAITWPTDAQAAIGTKDYGILASHETGHKAPTASVIKLVTALSILDKHPLKTDESGPTITISQRDVDIYNNYVARNGSALPVSVGQKLTERQALEALLIKSANNIADTLVTWAYGSHDKYRVFTAYYLKKLGLNNTEIGNDASGLDPKSISTASDMVKLGIIAMDNPIIADIVGKSSTDIPGIGMIHSTNNLLGSNGIIGIKTGTDYHSRGSYLFASEYKFSDTKKMTIIGSVLSAPSITSAKEQALTMLSSAKDNFIEIEPVKSDETVGYYKVPWSNHTVEAIAADGIKKVVWRDSLLKTVVSLNDLQSITKDGKKIGEINLLDKSNQNSYGKTSVILKDNIPAPSLWWKLTHPLEVW